MKKKSPKQRASSRRSPKKRIGIPGPRIVVYYSISTLVASLVFAVASLFLPRPFFPFCANSVSCIHNLNATVENEEVGVFAGQQVTPPQINLAEATATKNVLGETTGDGEKRIYVDLTTQTVYAYEGTTEIFKTLVATGKWGRTPTGDFKIWVKLRSTRMSGGSGADYYNLPNVPYTMFYYNDKVPKSAGYSLHGAYWHNNFGHEMSHGCVNLREVDAQTLYDWADPATESNTTHATSEKPGTIVSVCNRVEFQEGSLPSCVIEAAN